MKTISLKSGVVLCIVFLTTQQTTAQQGQPRTQPPANPRQQSNRSAPPSTFGNIPGKVDTGAADRTPQPSVRPTQFSGNEKLENLPPPEYEHVRWDDALYLQKVWREIDLREKMNQAFRTDSFESNGSQLFINILLRAIQTGNVTAFADDRFSIPVSKAEILDKIQGQLDTFAKMNPGKIDVQDSLIATRASFDPKSVTRLRIMEEWIFDKEGSRLYCRILGIAALKRHTFPLSGGKEREAYSLLFWLYYPDLRPLLSKTEVFIPKNMGVGRMTWDQLFQNRRFSSYIIKSTYNNVSNKNIREYMKDPKLALLEGEKMQEKIYNYEHDQWSY